MAPPRTIEAAPRELVAGEPADEAEIETAD
jgi:hypothetical protein